MTTLADIEIVPSTAALGAEIRGIYLSRPMDNSAFSRIEDAFNRHSVLCFRGRSLNEEQFLSFMDRFDGIEKVPLIERLARPIYQPPYRHTHKWRVGDLLMWDNCAVRHIATFDYKWPEERRLM
jgi:alpha-ketoglutarate-dependent taurine dioxygenase